MTDQQRFSLVPASFVFLRRGEEVLLQQRANTGYMDGHWTAGAAGHIEAGETAACTAVREAREELGVTVALADLRCLTVMHRTDGSARPVEQRVDWFWAATRWNGEPRVLEPHKCTGLRWHHLDTLPAGMPPYERLVLERWRDGALPPHTTYGFADGV